MRKKKNRKIIFKILWPFVIIFILIIISLVGSLSDFIGKEAHRLIVGGVNHKIKISQQHIDTLRDTMILSLRDLASFIGPIISNQLSISTIKQALGSLQEFSGAYVIQIIDTQGRVIAESYSEKMRDFKSECSAFFSAKEFDLSIEEKVSIKRSNSELFFDFYIPLIQQGMMIGHLHLFIQFGHFLCQQIQRDINVPVYLFIDGQIAAFSDQENDQIDIHSLNEVVKIAQMKETKIVERIHSQDKEYIAGLIPLIDPEDKTIVGNLIILIDTAIQRILFKGVIRTGSIYGLIGILILIFMWILIAKNFALPIVNLVNMTKKIGEGDLDINIKIESNDEIEELAEAFNRMTENLKKITVSKDYVDNIIRSMIDPLIVVDQQGMIITFNKALCDIVGYTEEEILFMKFENIVLQKRKIASNVERNRTGIQETETYIKTKEGKKLPVLLSKSEMKGKDRRMICSVYTAKDISHIKKIELELCEKQDYLKTILDSIQTGIIISDELTKKIFDINPGALRIIGLPKEQVVNGLLHNYIDSIDHFRPSQRQESYESIINTSKGEKIPILVSHSHLLLNGSQHILSAFIDITEQKRIEDAVLQSQMAKREKNRLSSLLEMMPAIIYLQTPNYKISFANRRFRDIFGQSLARPCYEIFNKRNQPCQTCPGNKVFEKKEVIAWEWSNEQGNSYEFYACPYTDIDGSPLAIVLGIDITDRKKAEEARKKAEHKVEEQRAKAILSDRLRSLGEMATGIAHELNQPLSGIRGLAEHILIGMERAWGLSQESIRENIEVIIEQTDRMSYIIEHTRMFSRGEDESDLMPMQVNEVIKSAEGLLGADVRLKGLFLKCELADNLPLVWGNPFSLEEVIMNLINNAKDALIEQKNTKDHSDSTDIIIRTALISEGNREMVKIEVIDCGEGIPEEICPKVFDPFFTTKSPDKGTGLGLAVSKSIIESFQGTIAIHSKRGSGTCVMIILPTFEEKEEITI